MFMSTFIIIGLAYYNGEGVDKDVNQSFIWLKKSADQGLTDAQFFLGNRVNVFIIDLLHVYVFIYNNRRCIL